MLPDPHVISKNIILRRELREINDKCSISIDEKGLFFANPRLGALAFKENSANYFT